LPPKVLFHDNRWRKETKGELTNPGSHGKWLLKWRYMGVIMKRLETFCREIVQSMPEISIPYVLRPLESLG